MPTATPTQKPTQSKPQKVADPIAKRLAEVAKENKVDLSPKELADLRDNLLDAAVRGINPKTVIEYKLVALRAQAEDYAKRLSA